MNEFLLLQLAHVVAFVYWLGGDLGTYVASNYTVNRNLGTEARGVALKIMLACDQGPKIAMPLILPMGIHMAWMMQMLMVPGWLVAAFWLLALVWLGNVLVLYFREGDAVTQKLAQFDLWMRVVVVIGLAAWAIAGLAGAGAIGADWVAWKLLVFAALVACGIMIRINLRPYIPAFARLMSEGSSDDVNTAMENSLRRCRPWVYGIWAGLIINAALGVHVIG